MADILLFSSTVYYQHCCLPPAYRRTPLCRRALQGPHFYRGSLATLKLTFIVTLLTYCCVSCASFWVGVSSRLLSTLFFWRQQFFEKGKLNSFLLSLFCCRYFSYIPRYIIFYHFSVLVYLLFLVPKLRSVAQNEWKK